MGFFNKKKKTTKRRKRRFRKRRKRLPRLGFPKTLTARVRVAGSIVIDAGANDLATYRLSCNAVHKPDTDGTSSRQPRHYGIYADIYNRYKVLGAKLIVKPVQNISATDERNNSFYGVQISNTGVLLSPNQSIIDYLEDPKAFGQVKMLNAVNVASTRRITSKWSIKRLSGGKNESDDVLDGITGNAQVTESAPSRQEWFVIWYGRAGLDTTINPMPMNFTYTIEYIVKFWDYNAKLPEG